MHAAALASELEISRLVCPRASGVLSALGLIAAGHRRDTARTVLLRGSEITAERVISAAGSRSPVKLIPYSQAFPAGGFEDMRRRVPDVSKLVRLTQGGSIDFGEVHLEITKAPTLPPPGPRIPGLRVLGPVSSPQQAVESWMGPSDSSAVMISMPFFLNAGEARICGTHVFMKASTWTRPPASPLAHGLS